MDEMPLEIYQVLKCREMVVRKMQRFCSTQSTNHSLNLFKGLHICDELRALQTPAPQTS